MVIRTFVSQVILVHFYDFFEGLLVETIAWTFGVHGGRWVSLDFAFNFLLFLLWKARKHTFDLLGIIMLIRSGLKFSESHPQFCQFYFSLIKWVWSAKAILSTTIHISIFFCVSYPSIKKLARITLIVLCCIFIHRIILFFLSIFDWCFFNDALICSIEYFGRGKLWILRLL
jgi:hypothetical protein